MRNQGVFSPFRWISSFFLIAAIILASLQLVQYSRVRASFPPGLKIAHIPVGGLNRQQAGQRLLEVYSLPVELLYRDAVIHLNPSVVDFQLKLESMLAAADLQRTDQLFWTGFWDYLWNRSSTPTDIPLVSSYSETRLREYLSDVVADRYDQPPLPAIPVVGTVKFERGTPGTILDLDGSVRLIENALHSHTNRQVSLPLHKDAPPRPSFQNLEILLKQTIENADVEPLVGFFLYDLQTSKEIHFVYQQGEQLPIPPDVAFTASSMIKIPIMVSVFRHDLDEESNKLLSDMITKSGNEAADWLMDRVIDRVRGPLYVSDDLEALGFENTFLAGYFSMGSPLLAVYHTPANQRTDVSTDPDIYNQTTPSDIGMLLADIYQCAENNGGTLLAVFPQELNQEKCGTMITYLKNNKLPVLLTAGVPEGTQIAHKHGWTSVNGIINTIGDAGIVYTPGGDYVLAAFLYHPVQLIWDPASSLIEQLSQAVYNYYNLPD